MGDQMNVYQVTDEFMLVLHEIHKLIENHLTWQEYNQWLNDNFGFVHGQVAGEYSIKTYVVTNADLFLLFRIKYGC